VDAVSADLEALARRVARLEATEAAKVTAARYGRACDAKDLDMLRDEVFTADAVLRLPNDRTAEGVETVVRFYRSAFEAEPGIRRHFVVNHIAEVADDGTVHIDSYFMFMSQDRESVLGWGAYRDVVVVEDGVGRIRDKTILIDVFTTLDAGWALGERAGAG
jgi:hypothetical protein